MPELPEVERAARRLRKVAVGRQIVAIEVLHPALRRKVTPRELKSVVGHTIASIEQQAKHQRILLDDGRSVHVHFRMAGDWQLDSAADEIPRFARAMISLDDGGRIVLVDPRALSTLLVLAADKDPFSQLGPDPFSATFDGAWLRRALQPRRGAVKPALLDQRIVAGLGNIYAAEALWEARISPRVRASSLSAARCEALVHAIRVVLQRGRGSRARYSDGFSGRFRVYDREGLDCPRCGSTIRRIEQAGRSTCYCPKCQAR
jgi:formamidopyrimidine-DNA glycosylase